MEVVERAIQEIGSMKKDINKLARDIYLAYGEYVSDNYDFSKPMTEQAKRCWNAAVIVHFNVNVKDFSEDDIEALLLP